MIIGSFGDVIFEVSSLKILTFDNFKRKTASKYASHELVGRPPVLEFLHRELQEISLTVKAIKSLGVEPEEIANQLRDMLERGEENFLIIGDTVICENELVLVDVTESVEMWHKAEVGVNTLQITLKEYLPRGD